MGFTSRFLKRTETLGLPGLLRWLTEVVLLSFPLFLLDRNQMPSQICVYIPLHHSPKAAVLARYEFHRPWAIHAIIVSLTKIVQGRFSGSDPTAAKMNGLPGGHCSMMMSLYPACVTKSSVLQRHTFYSLYCLRSHP